MRGLIQRDSVDLMGLKIIQTTNKNIVWLKQISRRYFLLKQVLREQHIRSIWVNFSSSNKFTTRVNPMWLGWLSKFKIND